MAANSSSIFREEAPRELSPEQLELKRQIYEKMNPRRRKFIERIGYERWDPFQPPNDPLDIRTDLSQRTAQDLLGAFARECGAAKKGRGYQKGVEECALGVINKDEKYQGIFDFCLWYHELLQREGHLR